MESESVQPSRTRLAMVRWTDLPPELLQSIARSLQQNPIDITRFRSVCQSWRRSSITHPPPPPNKISRLFPLEVFIRLKPHQDWKLLTKNLIANALYLLRSHREPSQSWIVSVHEPRPGKLLLRHPLTLEPIYPSRGKLIDFSEWGVTQITISCCFRTDKGNQIYNMRKAVFLSNSDDSDAMVLYGYTVSNSHMRLCTFRLSISDQTGESQHVDGVDGEIIIVCDFVNFNERIYVVDKEAHVYVFDSTNSKLLRVMNRDRFPDCVRAAGSWKRFVVSGGDLYIVLEFCAESCTWPECRVFKLVVDNIDTTCCSLENVEDLGGGVFFINTDRSFSVSERDLPLPLEGNCVILEYNYSSRRACKCPHSAWYWSPYGQRFNIYHLGGRPHGLQELRLMPSLYVGSALFNPPHCGLISWREFLQKRTEELGSCY